MLTTCTVIVMGFWNKAFKKLDKVLAKELTKKTKAKKLEKKVMLENR